MNKTHVDGGALRLLRKKFNIETMLDIGCGTGGMVELADSLGIQAEGVDGDFTLAKQWEQANIFVHVHDFSKGPPNLYEGTQYDLGWSVEFLEHVEQQYMDNYFAFFNVCRYVVCTAAPPGWAGHHHVNCQTKEYWIEEFSKRGFSFDQQMTDDIHKASTMTKPFMAQTGMFFENKSKIWPDIDD